MDYIPNLGYFVKGFDPRSSIKDMYISLSKHSDKYIICECGSYFMDNYKIKHIKTKKHLNFIENQ